MKLKELIDKFELKALTNVEDKDIKGVYLSDMLSDVMSKAESGSLWMTIQTHKNIVSVANLIDLSAIIITNDKNVPAGTIELANRFYVNILSSPLPTYELAIKLVEAGVK
ncbi:MAG: hypothetical protein K8R54_19985 [Bacteroidales bacterium]|nr:hypothetical protein [Bacteroidales bacterium]